jgi:uncharacterized membrane protein (DUF373 family)
MMLAEIMFISVFLRVFGSLISTKQKNHVKMSEITFVSIVFI